MSREVALLRRVTLVFVLSIFLLPDSVWGITAQDALVDSLPERWSYLPQFTQQSPDEDDWWKSLGDPVLDSLIHVGVVNNYDVKAALQRIKSAKAMVEAARSGYFPQIGLSAGWQRQRNSGMNGQVPGKASEDSWFNGGVSMNWELDVFGRITSGVKQKKAAYNVSRADYIGTMVSLAGEIADSYVTLRVTQAQLKVANEHLLSQQHIVKIAETRHEVGLSSALDVAQSRTVYYTILATIPPLKYKIHSSLNTLATLLGCYMSELSQDVIQDGPIPRFDVSISAGVPADLLRRRPDIVAAEQQLAGAAAALGVAKKDFLPHLTLAGNIGTSAHNADRLFQKESFTYSIAPALSWTVFSGLSRKYAVTQAKANLMELVDSYNATVMNAYSETDNTMYSYTTDISSIRDLTEVVEQSRKSLDLSVDLYKSGNTAFTSVADAQMTLLNYTNELLQAQGNAIMDLIALYKALGGSWKGNI